MKASINVKNHYRAIRSLVRQVVRSVISIANTYTNLPCATWVDADGSILIGSNTVLTGLSARSAALNPEIGGSFWRTAFCTNSTFPFEVISPRYKQTVQQDSINNTVLNSANKSSI